MRWISRMVGVMVVVGLVTGLLLVGAHYLPSGAFGGQGGHGAGPEGRPSVPPTASSNAGGASASTPGEQGAGVRGNRGEGGPGGGRAGSSLAQATPTAVRDATIVVVGGIAFWGLAELLGKSARRRERAAEATA